MKHTQTSPPPPEVPAPHNEQGDIWPVAACCCDHHQSSKDKNLLVLTANLRSREQRTQWLSGSCSVYRTVITTSMKQSAYMSVWWATAHPGLGIDPLSALWLTVCWLKKSSGLWGLIKWWPSTINQCWSKVENCDGFTITLMCGYMQLLNSFSRIHPDCRNIQVGSDHVNTGRWRG